MDDFDVAELADWAQGVGLVAPGSDWTRLRPGRTNRLWRVASKGTEPVVLKLFDASRATQLFPNDPVAEFSALNTLAGSGLAPAPVVHTTGPWGGVVVYKFVTADRPVVFGEHATTLRKLHRIPPPPNVRSLTLDAATILAQANNVARRAPTDLRDLLNTVRPRSLPVGERPVSAFLHGDPTPSNAVGTGKGVILIDWQCPASGDPVFDLACALSPSMQTNCRGAPLTEDQVSAFLQAYGDDAVTRRFRRWRAGLTWRLACHAAWRVAACGASYQPGLDADLALLERLQQQDA